MDQIFDIQMKRVRKLLAQRQLDVTVTPAARTSLCDAGFDPAYGARPLKRIIQRQILDPLSLEILDGHFGEGDHIQAMEKGSRLEFSKTQT
jgi:ATP-dependent Clp protease ATP-binding subunit ClpB